MGAHNMSSEVSILSEPHFTNLTRIWFISGMLAHVYFQRILLVERARALFTLKWFLPGMDSFVSLALAWFWKRFIAKFAFISITISTTSFFMAFLHWLQQMIEDGMLLFMIFILR